MKWFTRHHPRSLIPRLLYVAKVPWDPQSRTGQLLWHVASLGWHVDLLYETETQEVKKITDTLYVYSHWSLLLRTKYGVVWTEKLDPLPRRFRALVVQECHDPALPLHPDAQLLICTDQRSFEVLSENHPHVLLLPDGCPGDLVKTPQPAPQEFAHVRRPILGYVGSLEDPVALELLKQAATYYRYCSFALIGPLGTGSISLPPNVLVLGPRSRQELPAYVQHVDLLLLNVEDGQLFPEVYEYLALGKPLIVFTGEDLSSLGPLAWGSIKWEGLQSQLEQALEELGVVPDEGNLGLAWGKRTVSLSDLKQRQGPARSPKRSQGVAAAELAEKRRKLAFQNTWTERARQLLTEIRRAFEVQEQQTRRWF